jgi:uncharacterized integral membrane protein
MRVINALAALCFVALGLAFGALNRERVHVDLALGALDMRLGFLLIVVALVGACVGGLAVMAGVVWPMRRRARAARSPVGPSAEPVAPGATRNSGPVTAEFPAFREPPR